MAQRANSARRRSASPCRLPPRANNQPFFHSHKERCDRKLAPAEFRRQRRGHLTLNSLRPSTFPCQISTPVPVVHRFAIRNVAARESPERAALSGRGTGDVSPFCLTYNLCGWAGGSNDARHERAAAPGAGEQWHTVRLTHYPCGTPLAPSAPVCYRCSR